jgi:hypothetical protein
MSPSPKFFLYPGKRSGSITNSVNNRNLVSTRGVTPSSFTPDSQEVAKRTDL